MENTYWNHAGKYEKEYHRLWDKLVPDTGNAKTVRGEVLRCVSKLYYDRYNNGSCNYDNLSEHRGFLLWAANKIAPFDKSENGKNFVSDLKLFTEDYWKETESLYDEDDLGYVFKVPEKRVEEIIDAVILYAIHEEDEN
jgi:hypothetical protein